MSSKRLNLFFVVLIVSILAISGCGVSSSSVSTDKEPASSGILAEMKQRGTILVGTEATYPPFTFKDPQGILTGYDVDVMNEVAKRMGLKAQFVPTEWKAMFSGLDSKRFDVIANQVGINETRQKSYDFSSPYTVSGAQIVVNMKTTDVENLEGLKGKRVGTSQGSNYDAMAQNVGAVITHYPGSNEIFADLKAGRIDAAINDRLFVAEYLLKLPNSGLKAVGPVFNSSQSALTVRKGNQDLVDAANKALASMKEDGTLAKISEKWFGIDVSK